MFGLWRLRVWRVRRRVAAQLRAGRAAVARFPTLAERRPHGLASPLVVTLTSYPPRFPTLALTLKSLLDQSVRADATILWIGREHAVALPADVRALTAHGLTIELCEDMRSFTKLVPALIAEPNATYVTADDDLYYPPDWLERLVVAAKAHPGDVIGARVHVALRQADGALRPYREWEMESAQIEDRAPDRLIFPTGVGGVLYPPAALDPRVTDKARFLALCPRADDVWFFWMARLAGTRQRGLGDPRPLLNWDGTQEVGLLNDNLLNDGNDPQIAAMEAAFGPAPMPADAMPALAAV